MYRVLNLINLCYPLTGRQIFFPHLVLLEKSNPFSFCGKPQLRGEQFQRQDAAFKFEAKGLHTKNFMESLI